METDGTTRFYDAAKGNVIYPTPGELSLYAMNKAFARRDATVFGTTDCWHLYNNSGRRVETFSRQGFSDLEEALESKLGRAGLTVIVHGYHT